MIALLLSVALAAPVGPGADLRGADLRGAALDGADLRGARLDGADLTGASLREARLDDAVLDGAVLADADLTDADLSGAVLRMADLRGARLDGADLCGVDLTLVLHLGLAATAASTWCRGTAFPQGYEATAWHYRPFWRPGRDGAVSVRFIDSLGVYAYQDFGPDDPGEIDLYEDGKAHLTVSLASVDLVPPWFDWSHRHWFSGIGVTLGAGAGTLVQQDRRLTVLTVNGGAFVELLSFLVVEGGLVYGVTPAPGLDWDTRDDAGWYVGGRFVVAPGVAFGMDLLRAVR